MERADLTWAFLTTYYFPKFKVVLRSMKWDERYEYLCELYNDFNPDQPWEKRSTEPIKDMIEYVARKDYFHFFCMGFTVADTGHYTIHTKMREAMATFRRIR
jgi:hypothetical protein|tara:strand:+ start:1554 stop:1859 length:306 start_codon:yes stop_codon:yes gene_type:complete